MIEESIEVLTRPDPSEPDQKLSLDKGKFKTDISKSRVNIGKIYYEKLKKIDKATENFEKAIEYDPKNFDAC